MRKRQICISSIAFSIMIGLDFVDGFLEFFIAEMFREEISDSIYVNFDEKRHFELSRWLHFKPSKD